MQVFPLQCKARIQVSLKWTLPFGADFLAAVLDWPLGTAKEIVPFCWRLVKQAAAGLPESYPSGGTSTGTSTGLCHGQCLSDQQRSSYHVLWFLTSHPKVLASLSWPDIIFVFPASLFLVFTEVLILFLHLCLFCFLIFLSISTQSYTLSPVLSTCTLGTNNLSVSSVSRPRRREALSRNEK